MKAGKLDRVATIQRESRTGVDEYNQPIVEWTDVRTVPAEVLPVAEGEEFTNGTRFSATDKKIRVRYMDDITTLDRVILSGDVHEILGIRPLGRRHHGIEITVRSFVGGVR